MIRLISTGRFKTAVSFNDKQSRYNPHTQLYDYKHEVIANGPQVEFTPAYTEDGQALGYYEATIDCDKESFKEKFRNYREDRPTSQYDLISGLPTCMLSWLRSRNVLIQVTESSKKDILRAIKEGKLKKDYVNDDFGILSPNNKNVRIIQPMLTKATTEIVIDEIDDTEVASLDDIEAKVAEKQDKIDKELVKAAAPSKKKKGS